MTKDAKDTFATSVLTANAEKKITSFSIRSTKLTSRIRSKKLKSSIRSTDLGSEGCNNTTGEKRHGQRNSIARSKKDHLLIN